MWQGQHDYRHAQQARRELETTYGLAQTVTRRGVASERTPITQVRPGEYRMYADAGHHAPRVALAESVLAAANTTAGQGRAAFEAELTDRGIHYVANQAQTGTVSGYRFAAHTDHGGELVWFKASQLDKKLAWRQLSKVLEPLPAVVDERTFTREHDAELDRKAHQAREARIAARWAETGHPSVAEVSATLTEARTQLQTLDTHLAAARAVVENQVETSASQLAASQRAISSAGRLGRGRAQHRFDHLATAHSEQLGVPVTGADGRQRSYAVIRDEVLSARHGDQFREREHWAHVGATATSQMAVWEKIQVDNPDYGAHGAPAVRLALQFHSGGNTAALQAYRDYLTALPAPAVYLEREPSPAGAAILTDLAHPDIRQHRQQRLQDNLNALRAYQHQRTPPPAPTRTAPRTTSTNFTRSTPPLAANRNQDRGRGYGR